MKYLLPIFAAAFALQCAQSTIVLDPVPNKPPIASTAAIEGTLTLNVNLTTFVGHQSQAFSALLFQNGVPMASLVHNGSFTTDGAGQGTAIMQGVTTSFCTTGAPATLANGTYDLYFAINYSSQAILTMFPAACGAPGFLIGLPANLYMLKSQVVVNGDTTYSIVDAAVNTGRTHTFSFSGVSPAQRRFGCVLLDSNATAPATTHGLALYQTTTGTLTDTGGNGTITTFGGQTIRLPVGTYKYICYLDANNNATLGDTGDKQATGFSTVSGAGTTTVFNSDFSAVP